jgi:O-antigen/teichoic acid export membrane protein
MREKFLISVITTFITNLFSLITTYLLFLTLEVELLGIFAFANSFIALCALFLDIGLTQIYLQKNTEENFDEYFSIYFISKTILIVGNYIPLLFLVIMLNFEPILLNFMILKIASDISFYFAEIFRVNLESKKKIIKTSLVVLSFNFVKNGLIFFIIINLEQIQNPLFFLGLIYIISSVFYVFFVIIISLREFHFKRLDKTIMKDYLKATKPLILLAVISVVITNIGNVLLDLSYSHEALAYFYLVQTYIINLFLIISAQISQLFNTYFPEQFKKNQIKNIEEMTHTAEKYSSILLLFVVLFTYLHGELLFNILLPNYSNSVIYLNILILVPFLGGINRPYISHLIPSKRQKLFSQYSIFKNIIWLVLTLIVVPKTLFSIPMLGLGGIGLAFITLISWIVDAFFYRYFSKKIGINFYKNIVWHIIFAVIAYLSTYYLSSLFIRKMIQDDIIYILITTAILFGIFFLQLLLFKEINKKDFKFFISFLSLKPYKESLIQELKD